MSAVVRNCVEWSPDELVREIEFRHRQQRALERLERPSPWWGLIVVGALMAAPLAMLPAVVSTSVAVLSLAGALHSFAHPDGMAARISDVAAVAAISAGVSSVAHLFLEQGGQTW